MFQSGFAHDARRVTRQRVGRGEDAAVHDARSECLEVTVGHGYQIECARGVYGAFRCGHTNREDHPACTGWQRPAEAGGDNARKLARLVENPSYDRESSRGAGRGFSNRHRHR
jgi:hypothetical protein